MKQLSIPFIPLKKSKRAKSPLQAIDIEPWGSDELTTCTAAFTISHFNEGLRIQYFVTEPFLRVKKRKINGGVHKDNCVEFFLAFENESDYYNFEFNCLGSIKAGYGSGRKNRTHLPPDVVRDIENSMAITLNNINDGKLIQWEITIILPLRIFCFHNKPSFSGLNCSANFAKCGDNLPSPHFLSWVNIISIKPDFHQPSCFGKLSFETQSVFNTCL